MNARAPALTRDLPGRRVLITPPRDEGEEAGHHGAEEPCDGVRPRRSRALVVAGWRLGRVAGSGLGRLAGLELSLGHRPGLRLGGRRGVGRVEDPLRAVPDVRGGGLGAGLRDLAGLAALGTILPLGVGDLGFGLRWLAVERRVGRAAGVTSRAADPGETEGRGTGRDRRLACLD